MKIEELTDALQPMIQEAVKTQFKENEELKAEVEKKVEEKVEEAVKEEVVEEKKEAIIAAALKEDKTEIAQKEADSKDWKTFGEFCENLWMYRMGHRRFPDNRLVFIDKSGTPSVPTPQPELNLEAQDKMTSNQVMKTLTEGTDSAGRYNCLDMGQLISENSLNSGKPSLYKQDGNPELSSQFYQLRESVEAKQGASSWDEEMVQTTNII